MVADCAPRGSQGLVRCTTRLGGPVLTRWGGAGLRSAVDRSLNEEVRSNRGPSLRNRRRREHGSTHGGCAVTPVREPWPAASGACGYGVLARFLRNGEHQEADKLTARLLEVVAASWRAPKRVDDGDGDWRERKARG